jgi:7-cyano-7-deazaguanine synthase
MKKNKKHVVISLSGGMDSSTLLLRCLKEYDTCTAISFDYGQKHRVELERAQSLVDYINDTKIKVTGNLDQIQNDLLKFHGITPEVLVT